MTTDIQLTPPRQSEPISASESAAASSAHARVNIPLNLENWKALPEDLQQQLLWFHQHCLDSRLSLKEAGEALDYDQSTIFRVLKGTYEGSWKNVSAAIHSYRRVAEQRSSIQQNEFAHTPLTRMVWAGLDYALANNSVTLITGESRTGKSISAEAWAFEHNHGRSVFTRALPYGGARAFIREVAKKVGVNKNLDASNMLDGVYRAFNKNRMLIIDEAHRLIPADRRSVPVCLEIARDIRDETGAALGLIVTVDAWEKAVKTNSYMFEQIIGRIGMPVRLPVSIKEDSISPIVGQYVARPNRALMESLLKIANEPGRLGILVETLKVASRIAKKKGAKLTDDHVFAAIKLRKQMSGL